MRMLLQIKLRPLVAVLIGLRGNFILAYHEKKCSYGPEGVSR